MNTNRHFFIDLLRAVSILGVVLVHILAYNQTSQLKIFIWSYLQFVVVAFIFCSVFVLSERYSDKLKNISEIIAWYIKRIVRLLVPLYVYLIVHYTLWFLFPSLFSGLGLNRSTGFIIQSFLLIGGVSINWLPILFIELALLFPFLSRLAKSKLLVTLYTIAAVITTIVINQKLIPVPDYRFTMWIGWSLVFLLFIVVYNKEKNDKTLVDSLKRYIFLGSLGLLIFAILARNDLFQNKIIIFFNHKYPPDFIYLSYTTGMMFFLAALCRLPLPVGKLFKRGVEFLSKNSYSLFFIHFIIFDLVLTLRSRFTFLSGATTQFFLVLLTSLLAIRISLLIIANFAILKTGKVVSIYE